MTTAPSANGVPVAQTPREAAMVKAFGLVLRGELAKRRPAPQQVTVPAPVHNSTVTLEPTPVLNEVHVPAPVVNVTVDTAQLAAAVAAMSEGMSRFMARVAEQMAARDELLSQLLQVLAAAPAPTITNKITVPETTVPPAQVTVEAPRPGPRSATIKRPDGTTTTITLQ